MRLESQKCAIVPSSVVSHGRCGAGGRVTTGVGQVAARSRCGGGGRLTWPGDGDGHRGGG